MNQFFFLLLVGVGALSSLVGCGKKLDENQLPFPSYRLVSETDAFFSIVMVTGSDLCTGTIVGRSTVLTAAHCVNKGFSVTVHTQEGSRVSSDILLLGSGVEGDPHDLALIYLPQPIASSQPLISLGPSVGAGEEVLMVGFGCSQSSAPETRGKKRIGTNTVIDRNEFIEVATPGLQISRIAGPENRAGVCFGDSGGPLLKFVSGQWTIVGVTHGAYNESRGQISQFVDLSNPHNRQFISQYVR